MTKTITILCPKIIEYFDNDLLSHPIPKFCDDSENLWEIYEYINRKLYRKCLRCPFKMKKFEKMFNEFLELYERAKAKEIEFEKKTGKSHKRPFNYFRDSSRYHKGLYQRLRFKCRTYKF